ncbi:MAG: PorT family protein [Bacteroidales bacterium]|nr:PorT family protein [Bacteroidales bacterium]
MKRILTFIFAVTLISTSIGLHAQSFDGGLIAGPVVSQIDGDGYAGFHQLGCTAGAFARIPSDGPLSWQMELKYSLFGSHSSTDEVDYGLNPMNIRLHYVEFPVMLRYDLSKLHINGKILDFITLEFGLSGDFLIRGTQSANFEDNFDNSSWLLFSATGNIGIQFDVNDRLGFNIRSMNSITPCRLHPEAPVFSWYHYYNIALQATVVYTIIHAN